MATPITEKTKREIAALYADKKHRTHDMAAAYKITPAKVTEIAIAAGVEPRRPNRWGKRSNEIKKCPKCKANIAVHGARFCPFCATDIRSEKDVLIERATWLWQICGVIGANDRDKAQGIINDIINYLKKEG